MQITFTKYHGTGNDFIMIDDRDAEFDVENVQLISNMCSRRFGVGADGLILLRCLDGYDFEMVYFNSDGRQSSMCGNGGRCLVHFAHSLGVFESSCRFLAIDGDHIAEVLANGEVKLKMGNVSSIEREKGDFVLDTGSPHFVKSVSNALEVDVKGEGESIRYSDRYKKEGINVNFLSVYDNEITVCTYERGVEDETYSCGTGVTASAIAAHELHQLSSPIHIKTKGGDLKVYFHKLERLSYEDIWLEGPAVEVFQGVWGAD